MSLYYEIRRRTIEADVKHIKVIQVPVLIDLLKTTVETDVNLKGELVIIARNELKKWKMDFKFHRQGDTLFVIWNFGAEEHAEILELLSFTIRVHPDDYEKMDFPEGQVMVFTR